MIPPVLYAHNNPICVHNFLYGPNLLRPIMYGPNLLRPIMYGPNLLRPDALPLNSTWGVIN